MSHVVASYVCRKNMFYNQTSLKGFSTFSTISLTFSIVSVIPSLLKSFIAISLSSLRVLYRSTIHFACSDLITESLRETSTFTTSFPALNYFDTSLASQELYLSKTKDLAAFLALMSNGWNSFVKLWGTMAISQEFLAQNFLIRSLSCSLNIHDNKRHLLFKVTRLHVYFFHIWKNNFYKILYKFRLIGPVVFV